MKRAWHGELSRSNRERRPTAPSPIRCRCTVEAAWELTDVDQLAALDGCHLWTADLRRGAPPVAAEQAADGAAAARGGADRAVLRAAGDAYGGCKSWVELPEEPPAVDLIPALTDTAFEIRSLAVRDALGEPAGVGA